MDPEKLERIQLPGPNATEKTIYNHLLAERLIRIMNSAAQPGTWRVAGSIRSQGAYLTWVAGSMHCQGA